MWIVCKFIHYNQYNYSIRFFKAEDILCKLTTLLQGNGAPAKPANGIHTENHALYTGYWGKLIKFDWLIFQTSDCREYRDQIWKVILELHMYYHILLAKGYVSLVDGNTNGIFCVGVGTLYASPAVKRWSILKSSFCILYILSYAHGCVVVCFVLIIRSGWVVPRESYTQWY